MRIDNAPLYDKSLTGVLARLTHGILRDANDRAQEESARANASANSVTNPVAYSVAYPRGWLDRLDAWFWKQDMKRREAFLAQSTDIFDLEQRMRWLERGRD